MADPEKGRRAKRPQRPPSRTIEGRENELISASYDLAEKQIREGKASAQVLTHFLKLGTVREGLERDRLKQENVLLAAKTQALADAASIKELYAKALIAMRQYSGQTEVDEPDAEMLYRPQRP